MGLKLSQLFDPSSPLTSLDNNDLIYVSRLSGNNRVDKAIKVGNGLSINGYRINTLDASSTADYFPIDYGNTGNTTLFNGHLTSNSQHIDFVIPTPWRVYNGDVGLAYTTVTDGVIQTPVENDFKDFKVSIRGVEGYLYKDGTKLEDANLSIDAVEDGNYPFFIKISWRFDSALKKSDGSTDYPNNTPVTVSISTGHVDSGTRTKALVLYYR